MRYYDIFKFGKHKGNTFEYVFNNDPQYILWCLLNIDHFSLPFNYTIRMIEDKIKEINYNYE